VCEVWASVAGGSRDDALVRVPAAGDALARALFASATFTGTQRRGKELALLAHDVPCILQDANETKTSADAPVHARGDTRVLCVHLGMSGRLRWHETLPEFGPKEHVHVVWELEREGMPAGWMSFADPRRFGGLAALSSLDALAWRWRNTGPDALLASHDALVRHLTARLGTTTRMVKAALLDQGVIAGIGNIYADEALFDSGIAPQTQGRRLTPARIQALVSAVQATLNAAIQEGGSTLRDYVSAEGVRGQAQASHRVYGRAGRACVRCGEPLRSAQIAQRTTVWCPVCQPRSKARVARNRGA
jgi:formamidopyrimidine-DNA glycosylase